MNHRGKKRSGYDSFTIVFSGVELPMRQSQIVMEDWKKVWRQALRAMSGVVQRSIEVLR